jgi:hypothetical protein
MRTLYLAAVLALAATSANAAPGFASAKLSSGKDQKREESSASGSPSPLARVIALLTGFKEATVSKTPRLPKDRPAAQKTPDCEDLPSGAPKEGDTEETKKPAPSEFLFLAF